MTHTHTHTHITYFTYTLLTCSADLKSVNIFLQHSTSHFLPPVFYYKVKLFGT